jgi:hypothetical protein
MTEQFGKEPERVREARIFAKEPALMDTIQELQTGKQIGAYARTYDTLSKDPLNGELFRQQYPTLQAYLMANGVGISGATLSQEGQSALNKHLPR